MTRKRIADKKEPKTQLVVELPVADKNLIGQAAAAEGFRSLSDYVRAVMLDRAQAALGQDPTHPAKLAAQANADMQNILFAYIGTAPPAGAALPAVSFPSVRSFATAFSDRNRAALRHLASHKPESIKALAQALGYPYHSLTHHLAVLAGYGVVGYEGGRGPQLMPCLRFRRVRLVVPLKTQGGQTPLDLCCAVKSGEDESVPVGRPRIFHSMDKFAAALPPRAYKALLTVAAHKPESASALAQITGQDTDEMYKALRLLGRLGVLTMRGSHPKRPVLAFDGLSMEIIFVEQSGI